MPPQAPEAADIPILIDGLGELFGGLTSVIRVPGPENTLLAQGGGYLIADVCKTVIDVCGATSPSTDRP